MIDRGGLALRAIRTLVGRDRGVDLTTADDPEEALAATEGVAARLPRDRLSDLEDGACSRCSTSSATATGLHGLPVILRLDRRVTERDRARLRRLRAGFAPAGRRIRRGAGRRGGAAACTRPAAPRSPARTRECPHTATPAAPRARVAVSCSSTTTCATCSRSPACSRIAGWRSCSPRPARGARDPRERPEDRPRADGHHDAPDGWLRDDQGCARDARARRAADHRRDREGDAGRPREEHRRPARPTTSPSPSIPTSCCRWSAAGYRSSGAWRLPTHDVRALGAVRTGARPREPRRAAVRTGVRIHRR